VPIEVPTGRDAAALADWAELLLVSSDGPSVSLTRISRLLKGEGDDEAEEELTLDERDDPDSEESEEIELPLVDEGRSEREVRVEQLLDEIELRLRLGSQLYPFEASEERITWRSVPGAHVYLFLLALSWPDAPARKALKLSKVEAAYDNVCLEALRRYLGRGAIGVRFAKNSHDPDDQGTRPKKFREAITWLREQLELGAAKRTPPDEAAIVHWEDVDATDEQGRVPLNSYEDGGVDVVVWWRFRDDRAGSPVLLAQCTVQLEWGDKVSDISVDRWDKWIDFATVPPQLALVIPFAVNRESKTWAERTVDAGVIIDRLRLIELLDELETEQVAALVDNDVRSWTETQLAAAA
jgi:hypothetical protein